MGKRITAGRRITVSLTGLGMVATTGVLAVGGAAPGASLASLTQPTPFAHIASPDLSTTPPTTSQCLKAFGYACYSPKQIETAYDMKGLYGKGLTGTGETIALVDSFGSPTAAADLAAFDQAFGLPAPPSFKVVQPAGAVPPFNPRNTTELGWAEETSLDIEYSHAMAPGANILLVETPTAENIGESGFANISNAEKSIIDNHQADVISQSFGTAEATFPSAQSIFNVSSDYTDAEAHNVTVLASAGDAGTTDANSNSGSTYFTTRSPSFPASSPLVTAVGGTQLHLNDAGQRVQPDNVWNDNSEFGVAVGGGGVSNVFSRPSYQDGVSSVVGTGRGYPDVSLSAAVNGGVLVYLGFGAAGGIPAGFYIFGGTSESSPLMSGVVAIADQAAGHDLGLLNPKLYALGSGSAGLPDITIGNNTVTFVQDGATYTVPGYAAAPGYDLASGLGTVDGGALVAALSGKG